MTALFKKDLTLKMSIDNRIINNIDVKLEELPNHKCKFVIKLDSEVEIVKDNFLSVYLCLNLIILMLFCFAKDINLMYIHLECVFKWEWDLRHMKCI